ncbi:23S rRNA (pseudouridine(1915)-N(3))-methyltransferase RlmH [Mangrovicoccus algicola]|uniref:Ribosomal RNA large subunit methyltransferase H n=1 Tax=Mangrovicoccus algicola TaxID=2771008 RepID=A0A8J6ZA36_9RHOB|nr:23S rRNA (pseudouridine(1915)-N(3))-methyltransferase RlmH [Mangrovicoccus algicola]MBE3639170.1 23S rRNA (pseudouridine(1915)-N(3))-methyltransferase RlmH [Mangrovicoccus algicola]
MRIRICATGRVRGGPEAALIDVYLTRFGRTGRSLSLGPAELHEVEAKKGGAAEEARLLLRGVPDGARLIALDERGRQMGSPDFAGLLAGWRDDGIGDVAFAIGGAEGHAPELRDRADLLLSFGTMVWPHMLARVMLAEQLYRAATILAGSPYHKA